MQADYNLDLAHRDGMEKLHFDAWTARMTYWKAFGFPPVHPSGDFQSHCHFHVGPLNYPSLNK